MRMPPCPQTTSDRFGQAEAAARQRGEAGGAPPETPHGREPAAALHVRSAREVLAPCVEAARRLVADADLEEVAHALAQRPQPRIVRRAVAVSKHHLLKRLLSSEPHGDSGSKPALAGSRDSSPPSSRVAAAV